MKRIYILPFYISTLANWQISTLEFDTLILYDTYEN